MRAASTVLSLIIGGSSWACSSAGTTGSRPMGSGGSELVTTGGLVTTTTGTGTGGTTGLVTNGDTDAGESSCGHKEFNRVRRPAEVLLLLDRTLSMLDGPGDKPAPVGQRKWDAVVPAATDALTQTDSMVSWGLKLFSETDGKACMQGSVTSKIDVPVGPMNAAKVIAAIPASATGSGTPTGDAVSVAAKYLQMLADMNPKYILLATDGLPSCTNGTLTGATQENTASAKTDAISALSAAAMQGIHTFVVGVGTTASQTATLNEMAAAGLEPRPDFNPLATKFYLASTKDELVTSLKAIAGVVSDCTFPLGEVPPVPENIGVRVNGMLVPQDATHMEGWDYTGPDFMTVKVYGSWCDQIKTNADNTAQIVFACKGEIIK